MTRWIYLVTGQVQGVGFRPFIYRCATSLGLSGSVGNTPEGVRIEVQGLIDTLHNFELTFKNSLPPLAKIASLTRQEAQPIADEGTFLITASTGGGRGHQVLVSPDTALCDSCLADMLDPSNRRFAYAFTNCTDCGPRYTITRSIPYDRPFTSMACFPLCPLCQAEYDNPRNRRFHAQPNACPDCGPQVWFEKPDGTKRHGHAAIVALLAELQDGKIATIKGLGGFHLACDASNQEAVAALRLRKHRPHKALAIMVADVETARRFVSVNDQAEAALRSPRRPIVICPRLQTPCADTALAPNLAPDTNSLGVMLPYTPLHHLLFQPKLLRQALEQSDGMDANTPEARSLPHAPAALVMTSGNAGGEPICLGNREAKARLHDIADVFLFHDRDILVRLDDSVMFADDTCDQNAAPPILVRRARGFVPEALTLSPNDAPACVLGVGAQLKHTFCLTRQRDAFVSQHMGDLDHPDTLDFFEETLRHMQNLLEVRPQLIVCDAHPDYPSSHAATRLADPLAQSGPPVPILTLQHHFAHIHAVLAEHGHLQPALGLALDGSGLGSDGSIWGGELLLIDPLGCARDKAKAPNKPGQLYPGHQRLGHFAPFALPGGENAIREPWRMAEAMLHASGINIADAHLPWRQYSRFTSDLPSEKVVAMLREMLSLEASRIHCPVTTSCGRLFDAMAALCGVCQFTTYEGQAAIRLESAQDFSASGAYHAPIQQVPTGLLVLDTHALFRQAASDLNSGPHIMARRFHVGLAESLAEWARAAADVTGISTIALAGGVFNNRTLVSTLSIALRQKGLTPLLPRLYPVGDGAIALGQAAWGRIYGPY